MGARDLPLLNVKSVAALTGLSRQTLYQARVRTRDGARPDLVVPTSTRVGHAVGYALADLLAWERMTGRSLDWRGAPLSIVLPALDAYAAVGTAAPPELEALRQRVCSGRTRPASN
jgi:predicted DNA-binding transcriptional regulator AlpA